MKRWYFFTIIILLVALAGCAAMQEAIREAPQVEPGQAAIQQEAVSTLLDTFIPAPYRIPASVAIGYVLALLRRIYKKKHGASA